MIRLPVAGHLDLRDVLDISRGVQTYTCAHLSRGHPGPILRGRSRRRPSNLLKSLDTRAAGKAVPRGIPAQFRPTADVVPLDRYLLLTSMTTLRLAAQCSCSELDQERVRAVLLMSESLHVTSPGNRLISCVNKRIVQRLNEDVYIILEGDTGDKLLHAAQWCISFLVTKTFKCTKDFRMKETD
jgi:hypothetical protein